MSLETAAVLKDGSVATTGGTSTAFIVKGSSLNNLEMIFDDGAEFIAQSSLSCSIKDPKVNAGSPNGYTQARASLVLRVPLLLDAGGYTVNTMRIELAVDHETTDAEIESMLVYGAQLLHDSDFSDFWKKLSLG